MAQQPLIELGGTGMLVMHIALANGFPPLTYKPLLDPFTAAYRVVSLPPRPLWPGIGPAPAQPDTWRTLADDLLAGLRQYDLQDVVAIGHSFGGVASLLAVLDEPQRFRALVLLDPTILPPPVLDMVRQVRASGEIPRMPLVENARARRNHFASVDEAFDYWRGKPLFSDWSDAVLRLYAESMTRPAPDGGYELTWPPDWEAHYYLSIYADTWKDAPRLNGLLPVLVVAAEHTQAFPAESVARMRELLPEATHVTMPGQGHLFPQAAPDATRRIISDWLAGLG